VTAVAAAAPIDQEVDVLIAGGSLVGLSTALFLAWHGIRPLVVEQHRSTAIHPRAGGFTQRTIETYRSVGLEPVIRNEGQSQFLQDGGIMGVETLAGRELTWFLYNFNEGAAGVSPTNRTFITQNLLEPILRGRAEQLGAEVRFGTKLGSFACDDGGVTAVITDRDRNVTSRVRARYLIAADGGRSAIRQQLGIAMKGRDVFSNSVTIYFRADLAAIIGNRRLSIIYVNNPALRGFFRLEKTSTSGFLVINTVGDQADPNTANVAEGITDTRALELLRAAIGVPDMPIKIESILAWQASAQAAETFRRGPVFLVGDAAHSMPPNGGFGGNSGVHDAHNLAWKLAMVLQGKSGAGLLATYDSERRPIAAFAAEQAYSRYVRRTAPYLGTNDIAELADDLAIEIGHRYHSQAIDDDGGTDIYEDVRNPSAKPGTRAPHVFIQHRGRRISSIDLLGKNHVVFAGPQGDAWCAAACAAGNKLALAIDAYRIGSADDMIGGDPGFGAVYRLAGSAVVLIRPDGFIAWRAEAVDDDPERTLIDVLSRTLFREPVSAVAVKAPKTIGALQRESA
jgi:2-polyprenyl-6-methoxyphenol hydroxylase-like FAD-dependent oxidoreductase